MQSYFQASFGFQFWGNAFKDSECRIHWLPSTRRWMALNPLDKLYTTFDTTILNTTYAIISRL